MTTQLAPSPVMRLYDNSGNLAIGGLVYTYAAGTSTPATTYTDSTGTTPNTNPVVANSRGEVSIWLAQNQNYKLVAYDASNNLLWSKDQISSNGGLSSNLGAGLIGTSNGQTLANNLIFDSIAALRLNTATSASGLKTCSVTSYYGSNAVALQHPQFQGNYYIKTGDTTSADNGGTTIVDAAGNRWYLLYQDSLTVTDFGAKGDGVTDDTVAIQNALNWLGSQYTGELTGVTGAVYAISSSLNFQVVGGTHVQKTIDFKGAQFLWIGSQSVPANMFYLYGNKSLSLYNFTLICNGVTGTSNSANINGMFLDSLQPDGVDLIRVKGFYIREANIGINIGSVASNQNRVSDTIFDQGLLENCTVGVQTNSTNTDLQFWNVQLSGCYTGFNLLRSGYVKIDTCIGYGCQTWIAKGVIDNVVVINSQSEQAGLVNPYFIYGVNYTSASVGLLTFINCSIDNQMYFDYNSSIGSDQLTVNIIGGYFRQFTSLPPNTIINIFGANQTPGYTMVINGVNTKVNNYGGRIGGTVNDFVNSISTPLTYDVNNNVNFGGFTQGYANAGRTVIYAAGSNGAFVGVGQGNNPVGYMAASTSGTTVEFGAPSGVIAQLTAGSGPKIKCGAGDQLGFFGSNGTTKPTVSGAKGGNAALTSLISTLSALGLITDSTS